MALTLVETPGLASSNTYASLAEANAYHESHVADATWDAYDDTTKNAALAMATRVIDWAYEWNGYATYEDVQVLQWPREGLLDIHQLNELDETTIPAQIRDATAELARLLAGSDTTADLAQVVQGLNKLKVGSIELGFKETGVTASKAIPDSVKLLIPAWWGRLRMAGGSGVYRLVRA